MFPNTALLNSFCETVLIILMIEHDIDDPKNKFIMNVE